LVEFYAASGTEVLNYFLLHSLKSLPVLYLRMHINQICPRDIWNNREKCYNV